MNGPSEPLWLDLDEVLKAHDEQVAVFGGSPGVRDMALVESALARPQQLYHYDGERDVLTFAVRLGVGLAQNHPFVDGNKRTGTVATIMFLALNGYGLVMPNDEKLGRWMEAVIEDRMSEAELADALYPFVVSRHRE
ncbi:MAG TPA: type II toxin-antitoxin system death-on-curing family toxin [Allosphingosinicella sp.]|nr:type II toxin-antitoxin system death-on-curing family toxin [Allosphingosinicella sp.]